MDKNEVVFIFDGKKLLAKKGDTIASALWRNGIKVITRSIKFHRPRGLHCGTGDCPNCLANVNGIPNVRTCTTYVENGMVVIPQNKFISRNYDPLGILDFIYAEGFDYQHRFIRPRFAFGFYQRIIRRMTGIGRLPTATIDARPPSRLNPDLLIIGDEPAGQRVAEICSSEEDLEIVIVKKGDAEREATQKSRGTENVIILSRSSLVGAFDDGSIGVVSDSGLRIFKSRAVCLAELGREMPLRFVNWDLPGIIRSSAADRLLKAGITLGNHIVLMGETRRAVAFADMIIDSGQPISAVFCDDQELQDIDKIEYFRYDWHIKRAIGRNKLRKIEILSGKGLETIRCDCLITFGPIVPDIELARQLGCEISTPRNAAPRISVDDRFETSVKGVFALGCSIGQLDSLKSLNDANVAAEAILHRLRRMGR